MQDMEEAVEEVSLTCRAKAVVMEGHREPGKRRPKCMTQGRFDHQSPSYRDDGIIQHVNITAQVKVCSSFSY